MALSASHADKKSVLGMNSLDPSDCENQIIHLPLLTLGISRREHLLYLFQQLQIMFIQLDEIDIHIPLSARLLTDLHPHLSECLRRVPVSGPGIAF